MEVGEMATVEISLGETKLSVKQAKILAEKFHKHTVTLEYMNEDLDLDGNFVDPTKWKSGIWDQICREIGLNGVKKFKLVKNGIEDPTNCAAEISTWDQDYKGNIAFKAKSGDQTERQIKKNSKAPHVSVKPAGAKLGDCPADYQADLKHLLAQMAKTASYTYVGGTGSAKGWAPHFSEHFSHEQPGEGWKAYIEEPSLKTGSKWRLYFEMDFNTTTQTMVVSLTKISQDH
jgi:hypothetical protein